MMQSDNTFLTSAKSPLCELPDSTNPSSLLLAGVDTLGHAQALAELMTEKERDGGTSLMLSALLGAIIHATAMIEAGRKGLLETTP